MKRRNRPGRKLLVASIGVAAVSYVACSGSTNSENGVKSDSGTDSGGIGGAVGNLVGPDTGTGGTGGSAGLADAADDNVSVFDVVANLVAPDVGIPDAQDDNLSFFDQVANLLPPPDGGAN